MDERRRALRRRTLLSGRVELFRRATFGCVIRNLSDAGAKIRCDQQIVLPDAFTLIVEKMEERRQVKVVWRRGDEIGLKFMTPKDYESLLSFAPKEPGH